MAGMFIKTIPLIMLSKAIWLLFSVFSSAAVYADQGDLTHNEKFSLPTSDGLARINGVLSIPAGGGQRRLTPVIIAGGSVTSRDGAVYVSRSERFYYDKFWYRALANALVAAGFAVIRYDNRGMTSSLECERLLGGEVTPAEYIASGNRCYNPIFASTITFTAKQQDLLTLFEMVKKDRRLDVRRSIVIAHSEGGVQIAALVSRSKINPPRIIFIGTPVECLDVTARWQHVDRQVEWMGDLIDRSGGFVSNLDAAEFYQTHGEGFDRPLISFDGGWSKSKLPELRKQLNELQDMRINESRSVPGDTPIVGTIDNVLDGVVIGAAKYFQSMMADKVGLGDALANYKGKLVFIYGERDIKVSAVRQIHLIKASAALSVRSKTLLLRQLDHNLALPDGALAAAGIDAVVREAQEGAP